MADLSRATGGVLSYFTRHRTAANLLLVLRVLWSMLSGEKVHSSVMPRMPSNSPVP